jgi:hypothetical protein
MNNQLASQIVPLDEADAEYIEKARRAVEWHERWGRWLVAGNFAIAATHIGMAVAILYIAFGVIRNPGLLAGIGAGIGVGLIAGYFGAHGMSLFRDALISIRGFPEARLLVKYHDALAVALDRHNEATF